MHPLTGQHLRSNRAKPRAPQRDPTVKVTSALRRSDELRVSSFKPAMRAAGTFATSVIALLNSGPSWCRPLGDEAREDSVL